MTSLTKHKRFFAFLACFFIAWIIAEISIYFFLRHELVSSEIRMTNTVVIHDDMYRVDVSDTDALRTLGLSGRKTISPDEGMLFIFPEAGMYHFWMKDMNFPIDIVYLDTDMKIISVFSNVLPSSYPNSVVSEGPALYVLELRGGIFEDKKYHIGDQVKFLKNTPKKAL